MNKEYFDRDAKVTNEYVYELESEIEKLQAENQRLREALELYANKENWDIKILKESEETGNLTYQIAEKALRGEQGKDTK